MFPSSFWIVHLSSRELQEKIESFCASNECRVISEVYPWARTSFSYPYRGWFAENSKKIGSITFTGIEHVRSISLKIEGIRLSIRWKYGSPLHTIKKRHVLSSCETVTEKIEEIFNGAVKNSSGVLSVTNETPYPLKVDNRKLLPQQTMDLTDALTKICVSFSSSRFCNVATRLTIKCQFFENEEALQEAATSRLNSIQECPIEESSEERLFDFESSWKSHYGQYATQKRIVGDIIDNQFVVAQEPKAHSFRWVTQTHRYDGGGVDPKILFCGIEKGKLATFVNDSGIPLALHDESGKRFTLEPQGKVEAHRLFIRTSHLLLQREEYSLKQLPLKNIDIETIVKISFVEKLLLGVKIVIYFIKDKEQDLFLQYEKEQVLIENETSKKIRFEDKNKTALLRDLTEEQKYLSRAEIMQNGLKFHLIELSSDDSVFETRKSLIPFTLFEPPTEEIELKEWAHTVEEKD